MKTKPSTLWCRKWRVLYTHCKHTTNNRPNKQASERTNEWIKWTSTSENPIRTEPLQSTSRFETHQLNYHHESIMLRLHFLSRNQKYYIANTPKEVSWSDQSRDNTGMSGKPYTHNALVCFIVFSLLCLTEHSPIKIPLSN